MVTMSLQIIFNWLSYGKVFTKTDIHIHMSDAYIILWVMR